jgi:hypothetical protein
MQIKQEELITILSQFNPWWRGEQIADLPNWKRAAFGELYKWVVNPPAARATFLSGARQIGKTTLIMQAIDNLIKDGVPASNIFYATLDAPSVSHFPALPWRFFRFGGFNVVENFLN